MAETPISPMAVYTARPTVRIDSQEYPMVSELIERMEMAESEGGMSALELRVSNFASDTGGGADFAFEDDRVLKLGASIAIYSGDENAPQEIFSGVITGLEAEFKADGPPTLTVLAEDTFQQARIERHTQTYADMPLADVARAIAGRLGLTPVIAGLDARDTWVQFNESDLAFLRRLLARYDADLQIVGREMHVSPRGDVRRGTVDLEFGSQLLQALVTADLSQQVSKVTVTGWDAKRGERINESSSGANAGPGSGRTGQQILSQTLGERDYHLNHLIVGSADEARALAEAAFDQRARRLVCLEGTAEGNAALRVGTHVSITGLGPRFSNTYYVTRATHRYDLEKGYETDFEAECAFWGE